jgi:hypothetical protein
VLLVFNPRVLQRVSLFRLSYEMIGLRKHDVDPLLVVNVWLAVEMIVRDDVQGVDTVEFRRVQAAKIVHRLASGTHKRWAQSVGGMKELHVYPANRGNVLRYIALGPNARW